MGKAIIHKSFLRHSFIRNNTLVMHSKCNLEELIIISNFLPRPKATEKIMNVVFEILSGIVPASINSVIPGKIRLSVVTHSQARSRPASE